VAAIANGLCKLRICIPVPCRSDIVKYGLRGRKILLRRKICHHDAMTVYCYCIGSVRVRLQILNRRRFGTLCAWLN